jgi:hypothetical protein
MITSSSCIAASNFKVTLVNDLFGEEASLHDREFHSASRSLLLGNLFCTRTTDDVAVAAFKDWRASAWDGKAFQERFNFLHAEGVGAFHVS